MPAKEQTVFSDLSIGDEVYFYRVRSNFLFNVKSGFRNDASAIKIRTGVVSKITRTDIIVQSPITGNGSRTDETNFSRSQGILSKISNLNNNYEGQVNRTRDGLIKKIHREMTLITLRQHVLTALTVKNGNLSDEDIESIYNILVASECIPASPEIPIAD